MASIALDYLAAEYMARGEARGIRTTKIKNALAMFADHLSLEKIAKYSNLSIQEAADIGKQHGYL